MAGLSPIGAMPRGGAKISEITGALNHSVPALTQVAAGVFSISGAAGSVLFRPEQNIAAALILTGAAEMQLPGFTQAAAGQHTDDTGIFYALHRAVYEVLVTDSVLTGLLGADKIFDFVTPKKQTPYLVIGDFQAQAMDTMQGLGLEHRITLQVFSHAQGQAHIKTILARIYDVLRTTEITIQNHQVLTILPATIGQVKFNNDDRVYSGTQTYRFVTEELN